MAIPSEKRRHMRDIVGIGQRWRRKSDGHVYTIRQIHRADKLVELETAPPSTVAWRTMLKFKTLRQGWELLVDLGEK